MSRLLESPEALVDSIKEHAGNIARIAKDFNVSRATIYNWLCEYPVAKNTFDAERRQRGSRKGLKSEWLRSLPSNKADSKKRFLYIVRESWRGMIKIGIANDLYARLSALRSSMPQDVELIGHYQIAKAESLERFLHHRFSEKRYSNEWFELDDNDLESIVCLYKEFQELNGRWVQESLV